MHVCMDVDGAPKIVGFAWESDQRSAKYREPYHEILRRAPSPLLSAMAPIGEPHANPVSIIETTIIELVPAYLGAGKDVLWVYRVRSLEDAALLPGWCPAVCCDRETA